MKHINQKRLQKREFLTFISHRKRPIILALTEISAICGITEDELKSTLMPGVHDFAESMGVSDQEMLGLLKKNYDGYHFSEVSPDIYNPFSLLNALQSKRIDNYWFESGTPASFLKALRRDNFYLPNLECIETTSSGLSGRESFLRNPVTLLYESGYLTIKDYDDEARIYTLAVPNEEVLNCLTKTYPNISNKPTT